VVASKPDEVEGSASVLLGAAIVAVFRMTTGASVSLETGSVPIAVEI
jgi:hypothetical protein